VNNRVNSVEQAITPNKPHGNHFPLNNLTTLMLTQHIQKKEISCQNHKQQPQSL